MKTFQDIKNIITSQNLSQKCVSETSQMTSIFNRYVSSIDIDRWIKVDELNYAFSNIVVTYIQYDELNDVFLFFKDKFNKSNGVLNYMGNESSAKWVRTIQNEYVLMSDAKDDIGNKLKYTLPVIYKNS